MIGNKNKRLEEELSNSSNTIGAGTAIEGDISTHGNLRVDGSIVGNVTSKAKAVLGQSSKVEGTLTAVNAEISGEVKGTVEVAELLILRPTAVVNGDINTGKLIVESGAQMNGATRMGAVIKEIKIERDGSTSRKEKTA